MSLNARAIALQGLGFGALLLALQGLVPTTPVTPPTPELPSYTLPVQRAKQVKRIEGLVSVPSYVVRALQIDPTLRAAARLAVTPSELTATSNPATPKAGSRTVVQQTTLLHTQGSPGVSGQHDIADEDLIAALLQANFFDS